MNPEQEQQISRAIFREAHDAFVIVQPADLRVVEANPALQRLTGFRRKQVIGMTLADLIEADRSPGLEEVIRACQTTSCLTARDGYCLKAENGARVPVHVTVSRIHLEPEPLALLVVRNVSERKRAERRDQSRRDVLEHLAKGQALPAMLAAVVAFVERESADSICSILLLDESGRHLLLGAAPRLPDFYNQAIHGIEIGPTVGSCGTAAYTGCRVIVEDIETHPLWTPYREVARRAGLRSCWSEPIMSSAGRVLGTFAIYHAQPHSPPADELELITIAAHLASIAIERQQVVDALRQSEAKYRELVQTAHSIILSMDTQGRVTFLNAFAQDFFGYREAEILGRSVIGTLVPPKDSHGRDLAAMIGDLCQHPERCTNNENENVRRNGQRVWVRWTNKPIQDVAGAYRGVLCVGLDITERKQAEEALRESEQRYRSLVELAPEAVLILEEGCISYCNPAGLTMLGAPLLLEVVLGKPIWQFLPPEERAASAARIRTVTETGQAVPARYCRLNRLDGTQIYVETRSGPCMHNGRSAIQVIARDVTERKRAEEALQLSEERYRRLVETSPDAITVTDLEGTILLCNQQRAQLHGFDSPDQMIARPAFELMVPEDEARARANMQLILERGGIRNVEYTMLRRDGTRFPVELSASLIKDKAGEPQAFIGMLRDITERKRAEEERRKLEAQMQHSQKLESLGVLAGGIAHDFNNLLTGMLGYASLALMQLPEESVACPMLREIEKAAQRAADLTQQMLAYSGRGKFVVRVLRLDTLVQEMTKLLGTVVSKKARLNLNLEPATIEGDATQVRQVVMNLITNASDALDGQPGIIGVRTGVWQADAAFLRSPFLPEQLPAGGYAYVEVEDTGCGMTEETLGRIFDPFFTTKFTGRGLGLAAVLGIIKGHRGTIKVNSTPGQGTVFQILFPCYQGVPGEDPDAAPQSGLPRGQGTVLIVEDEPSVRTFARGVLESVGFQVIEASDGREGLDLYARHRQEIGAVLLDLTMPRMDGLEVLGELRRIHPEVSVLVMSGYSELEVATRFAGMGASGFIQKPFHPRDLLARVCQLLPATVTTGRQ